MIDNILLHKALYHIPKNYYLQHTTYYLVMRPLDTIQVNSFLVHFPKWAHIS